MEPSALTDVLSRLPLRELGVHLDGDLGNLRLTNRQGRLLGQLLSTTAFLTVDAAESTSTVLERLAFMRGQEALVSVSIDVRPHAHDITVHRQALLRAIPMIGRAAACRPGCLASVLSRLSLTLDEHCLIRADFLRNMDRRRRRLPSTVLDIDLSSTIASLCRAFPVLQHLNLHRVIMTGAPFLPLCRVETLTTLDIDGMLTSSALASIGALTQLRSLRVHFALYALSPQLPHGVDVRPWVTLRRLTNCSVEGTRIDRDLSTLLSLSHMTRLVASHVILTPLCLVDSATLGSLQTLRHLDLRAGCNDCHAWDAILSLSLLTHLRTIAALPAGYIPRLPPLPHLPHLPHLQHLALCSVEPMRPSQVLRVVQLLLPLRLKLRLMHLSMTDLHIWADKGDVGVQDVALRKLAGHLASAPQLTSIPEVRLVFWSRHQPQVPMSLEQVQHGLQPLLDAARICRIFVDGVPAGPLVRGWGWTSLVYALDLTFIGCAHLVPADEHEITRLCALMKHLPAVERIRVNPVLLTKAGCTRLALARARDDPMMHEGTDGGMHIRRTRV